MSTQAKRNAERDRDGLTEHLASAVVGRMGTDGWCIDDEYVLASARAEISRLSTLPSDELLELSQKVTVVLCEWLSGLPDE